MTGLDLNKLRELLAFAGVYAPVLYEAIVRLIEILTSTPTLYGDDPQKSVEIPACVYEQLDEAQRESLNCLASIISAKAHLKCTKE